MHVAAPAAATEPSVTEIVRGLQPVINEGRALWSEALEGERAALTQTRATQQGQKGPCPEHYKRTWLRTAHRLDDVLKRTAPELDPNALIESIDLKLCPAVCLKVDAYWYYARANKETKENDTIDMTLLAPIPYVRYALIENRLAEFVRQARHEHVAGRVYRDPVTLLQVIDRP